MMAPPHCGRVAPGATMGAPKRTPSQNRRMWGLLGQLAKTTGSTRAEAEGALRRHVREVSGQEHTSQLTEYQASQVIQRLEQELRGRQVEQDQQRKPWGHRGPGPREGQMVSRRQLEVLEALFLQAGMDTRDRQMGFTKRQVKKPWVQTQRDFDAVFEPLKAIVLRKAAPRDVWARAKALAGHPKLNRWQQDFVPDLARQFQEAAETGDLDCVLTPHKLYKLVEAEVACGVEVAS